MNGQAGRRRATVLACALLAMAGAFPLHAQPDPHQRMGTTLASTGATAYTFQTLPTVSADDGYRYRIRVAVPRAAAPAAGHPALYLLDGNAALMALDDADLPARPGGGDAPVLVFIASDNDLRIDGVRRTLDYTPPRPNGAPATDVRGRPAGGAEAFLRMIETRVMPAVHAQVEVDRARETLWGHSYGGLFALHVMFSHPGVFDRYVAADPSLWWNGGQLLDAERVLRREGRLAAPAGLLLVVADDGARSGRARAGASTDPLVEAMHRARAAVPPGEASRMAARLGTVAGLEVDVHVHPGLDHGQLLGASLPDAIAFASQD